jgi:hypothetical protein
MQELPEEEVEYMGDLAPTFHYVYWWSGNDSSWEKVSDTSEHAILILPL